MQTLIAIGALAIAITFALSTQRAEIKTDKQKVMAEMQILAGQVATNVLAHIAVQEFDANTGGGAVDDPAELTSAPFSTGKDFATQCDDVDDFHEMRTHRVNVGSGLDFDVDARVRYVNPDATPSTTNTFQKEVIVTVRDVPRTLGGEQIYILPAAIELRQIVAMGS